MKNLPNHLTVTTLTVAIGSVLEQSMNGNTERLSKKPSTAKTKYNTLYRELLTMCFSINHVTLILEGKQFLVLTYYKPLSTIKTDKHDLQSKTDKSSREARHKEYISQLSSNRDSNAVADTLPRAFKVDAVKSTDLN
uniref:Reverse transcriptase RNase H-like domain-containing protein n=1 Tax=Glossina palpalis gambiensis TaxID=67801 RepID=A0A1B0C5K8_9MUSC